MWLITNFGFFSVVEKPEQKGTGFLTVRARVKSDLESLRERYLGAMGPIEEDSGRDYEFRAVAPAAQVAAAFCKAIADIDYSNFKDSAAANQGPKRSSIYHDLWYTLSKLAADKHAQARKSPVEPFRPAPARSDSYDGPQGHASLPRGASCGGVVIDSQGRVLLRKPTGGYGGLAWTFPKGKPNPVESPDEAAVREVREETGYEVRCGARIPGVFQGAVGGNVYFLMEPVKDHHDFEQSETEAIKWATFEDAETLLSQSTNAASRKRDLEVLEAALVLQSKLSRDR